MRFICFLHLIPYQNDLAAQGHFFHSAVETDLCVKLFKGDACVVAAEAD